MNNILYLTLPGQPIGKARSRRDLSGKWYNPQSKEIEIAKREIKRQLPDNFKMIEKGIPVEVNISFFFEPTKNEKVCSKSFLKEVRGILIPCLKKPDRDNLDKFVLDCLSKIVFYDDNQVYKGTIEKYYIIQKPKTTIEVMW